MRPESRDTAWLWDMLETCREISEMLAENDLPAFLENRILVRAIERNIELLGEAARRISDEFKTDHPEIPWRTIIGQRNILAHEYGHVDHELLYRTAAQDVPELAITLTTVLSKYAT